MIFSNDMIAESLAMHLADVLPGVTFYEDPNQQETVTPCCFLQQRYASIDNKLVDRYLRTIGLDLTYLEDYNLPDLQRRYQAAAEKLDGVMETFHLLESGGDATLIRTYERNWTIDLDALHYKFELRIWVKPEEPFNPMRSYKHKEVVTNG